VLAVVVTHADAESPDESPLRALSDQGRTEVDETAARFRTIIADLAPHLSSDRFAIGEIISSPLVRCVETALRFSDAIKDLTKTSEMRLDDRLRAGNLSADRLVSVLDGTKSPAVLLCTHADLAGTLPANATLKPGYSDADGWFQRMRPVLVVIEYERHSEWDNANVLCCESPANNWEPLLAK